MKTFLFLDFDNTLMGTEQYAVPSLIDRFNSLYGDKIDHLLTFPEFKTHFHGQARETLCANLSKHFGIAVDYAALYDAREWRMMQHLQNLAGGVPMAQNLIAALEAVQGEGAVLSFVSNNPIQRALAAMRYADNGQGDRLANMFGTRFFEAGDVQKPKPDVYLRAMQQVGATASNSFAVEDSVSGSASAVSAGITTFAYTGFADDAAELGAKLLGNGCVAAFGDWSEFPALYGQYVKKAA